MIPAPWTAVHDTPNKSPRQDVPRRGVVLHHAATTSLDALRTMEVAGTKQVSSTAICKDDALELIVPDGRFRPWSLASAYWDSALRSVETCNQSSTGWTVSDASHESLARAVAYWAEQDGFHPHRDGDPAGWTVYGHREIHDVHGASYATACPGGLDLDRVTRRAQQLLTPPPTTDPALTRRQKEPTMYVKGTTDTRTVYNVFTDANGHARLRVCGPAEAGYATTAGLVTVGDDATLTLLAKEAGYKFAQPIELPTVKVAGT